MKIKVYNKFELAKLYYPNSSNVAARHRLMRMIKHCRGTVSGRLQSFVENLHHATNTAYLRVFGGAKRCF